MLLRGSGVGHKPGAVFIKISILQWEISLDFLPLKQVKHPDYVWGVPAGAVAVDESSGLQQFLELMKQPPADLCPFSSKVLQAEICMRL